MHFSNGTNSTPTKAADRTIDVDNRDYHYLSHPQIACDKRIYQHLSGRASPPYAQNLLTHEDDCGRLVVFQETSEDQYT